MKTRRTVILLSTLAVILLMAFSAVMAEEDRINQVHHFGGDSLFCAQDRGCWLLNMQGDLLWEVPQTIIDNIFELACADGHSQFFEAGLGTYGPNTLGISCYLGYEPALKLFGYDEWGKLNTMPFPRTYEPVYAPQADPVEEEEHEVTEIIPPLFFCVPPFVGIWPACELPELPS